MVAIYATLIMKGKKRVEDVPVTIREEVERMIKGVAN